MTYLTFYGPGGSPLYVKSDEIIAIVPSVQGSEIRTQGGAFFVKDKPEDILKRLA
jgi:hypothetical protein